MRDFTYRTDEWTIGDDVLIADVEITLEGDGGRHPFTVYNVEHFDANGKSSRIGALVSHNTAPLWIAEAMRAWVAANQDKLRELYAEGHYDDEQEAEDLRWAKQLLTTLPSKASHL